MTGRNSLALNAAVVNNAGMPVEELLVAGYVFVRPATSPPGMNSTPAEILTISDCIMDDLPRPEFWDWFQSRDEALAAQPPDSSHAQLVEVALERRDAADLIGEMGREQLYFELLQRSVESTGRLLGYEIVGAEWTFDLHSWHCHSYADDLLAARAIRLNQFGLFSTLADARTGLAWMCSLAPDEAPAPVPWFVVALFAMTDHPTS